MSWNFIPNGWSEQSINTDTTDNSCNSNTDIIDNSNTDNIEWTPTTVYTDEVDEAQEWMEVSTPSNESYEISYYGAEDKEDELEWNAIEESSIEAVIDNVWATDEAIASGLWYLAQNAEKPISLWDGEYDMVHNDSVKLEALKTLAKMKGHFESKKRKKTSTKGIKYILIREPEKNPLL